MGGYSAVLINPAIMALVATLSVLTLFGRWSVNSIFLSLLTLVLYVFIISFLHGTRSNQSALEFLATCCFVLCPFLACQFMYNAVLKLSSRTIIIGITVLIALLMLSYSWGMLKALYLIFLSDFRGQGAYVFLMFIPMVCLFPNKKLRYLLVAMMSICVLSSMKRGGMLALVFSLFVYNIADTFISSGKFPLRKILVLCVFCLLLGVGFLVYDSMTEGVMTERFEAASQDGGSGRDQVYEITCSMIADADLVGFLIGHGWDAVRVDSVLQKSAHNDFLEYLYDFGIVGFLLLVTLFFNLVMYARHLFLVHSRMAPAFAFCLAAMFVCSMLSHFFFYQFMFIPGAMFWGYCLGLERKEKLASEIISNTESE